MKSLLVLAIALSASYASAFQDYGIEAGFRSQNFDTDLTTASEQAETAYQLGVTGSMELSGPFVLKSGLMYVQRPLKYTIGAGDYKLNLTYFDIPLFFGYKTDYVTVYVGPSLGVKLSDSQSGTLAPATKPTAEGVIVPVTLGAAFRFAPQIGANVFFEMGTGKVASSTATGTFDQLRAVGVNLVVFLD